MKNCVQWQIIEKSLEKHLINDDGYCPFTLELARKDFWEYRKLIHPNLKLGWFLEETAGYFKQFAEDLISGKKPVLILESPPQHGKSMQVVDFISWISGKYPILKTIFASYSKRLGVRANKQLQRIYSTDIYQAIFPNIILPTLKDKKYSCNQEIIEYAGEEGSFRNTTIEGVINGEALGLGVIDDPTKGRKEANSQLKRDTIWDWVSNDFFSRFSEDAGVIMVLTRWHLDDPAGRLIDADNSTLNLKILKYPAIAVEDEEYRKKGDALFPSHKSLEYLNIRKNLMASADWESLYQQNPVKMGGNMFQEEWLQYFKTPRQYKRIVLSWDTAYKAGAINDYSVCGVWGEHDAGYDLLYVYRKHVDYPRLKKDCIELADEWVNKRHLYAGHVLFSILIEDKSSGQSLIQDMRNETEYNIVSIKPDGDKITRAHVCTPQFESSKVFLLYDAPWLEDYIQEILTFPDSVNDDQVDMTSQFLNSITTPLSGNITDDMIEPTKNDLKTDLW